MARDVSNTLNYMSVPGDGSHTTLLMPKLKYRFRVGFTNFGAGSDITQLTNQVVDVTRPKGNFENIVLDVYNSKINIAGRHTWDPISLTLRDDMSGNIATAVGKQLQKQFDYYEQESAYAASDYKFRMTIEMLDGTNQKGTDAQLDVWELGGCYIQSFDNGNLAYNANEAATIQLTIYFDNAILKKVGGTTLNSTDWNHIGNESPKTNNATA